MSEVRRAALVIGVVVALGATVAVWLLRPAETTGLRRSVSGAPDPFDERGAIVEGAGGRAVFNPTGTRVAILGGRGVAVAEEGRLRFLTEGQVNVVDLAWLPGTTKLLVAEGPALTGRLSILGVDGKAAGYVELSPSVGFGSGHGMTVDEDRRLAVVTASVREPLGREHLHLVAVDLATGATRALTPADGPDEVGPHFTAGGAVAYTVREGSKSSVSVIDPATGETRRLSPEGSPARAVGALAPRFAVYAIGATLWGAPARGGEAVVLGTLEPDDQLVAVDPSGGRVLVVRSTASTVRLQTVPIRRPR